MGIQSFLQGIFLIQGLTPGLPHCRRILYHLSHQGNYTSIKKKKKTKFCQKRTEKSTIWLMLLFDNKKVLEISKVGQRDNLIPISKMKEYSSENDRWIISIKMVQAEYAILLLHYNTLPSIRTWSWRELQAHLYPTAQMRKLRCKVLIVFTQDRVSGQYNGQSPSLLTPRLIAFSEEVLKCFKCSLCRFTLI